MGLSVSPSSAVYFSFLSGGFGCHPSELGQVLGRHALESDSVHLVEERVGMLKEGNETSEVSSNGCLAQSERAAFATHNPFAGSQKVVHLLGSDGTLKLLAVQQPGLDPLEALAGLDELFGALAVSSTVAGLPGKRGPELGSVAA